MHDWIKLHTAIRHSSVYKDHNVRTVFFHLLVIADENGKGRISRFETAKELGIKPNTFRSLIKRASERHQLITTKSTNKFTDFSINNWNKYQQIGTTKNTNKIPTGYHLDTTYIEKTKNKTLDKSNGGKPTTYGNPLVNFVIDWFTKHFKHDPVDRFPRRSANTLVRQAQALIKAEKPDFERMSLEDRTKGILAAYFDWMSAQSWSENVKTMQSVQKNFGVWMTKELGRGKYEV